MSADNGVYVLETGIEKKEWRVAHLQAVENIYYDDSAPDPNPCPDRHTYHIGHSPDTCPSCIAFRNKYNSTDLSVLIKNAREMWSGCKVFNNEIEAFIEAQKIYKDLPICEYGIQSIVIPRDF